MMLEWRILVLTRNELNAIYDSNMITEEDIICKHLEDDYCLMVNDVAAILGFSQENVQNNILPYLMKCRAGKYIKRYMRNKRVKIVISKESLCEYITQSLYVQEAYYIHSLKSDTAIINSVLELVGNKRQIQKALNYVSDSLNTKYASSLESYDNRINALDSKIKRVKENNINVVDYIAAASWDIDVIQQHYMELKKELKSIKSNEFKEQEYIDMYNVFSNDMYSIRQLKDKLDYKHTQQVYRFLDKVSHVVLKLGDTAKSERGEKGDRNTRYIISKESFNVVKDAYFVRLSHSAYENIDAMCQADLFNSYDEHGFNTVLNQMIIKYVKEFVAETQASEESKDEQ